MIKRVPRITAVLPDKMSGVTMWRIMRPLGDLHKIGVINFAPIYKTFNEHDAYLHDIIYIAHAHHESFLKLAEAFKHTGGKVWVDMDDLLTKLPAHNQGREAIERGIDSTKKLMGMADLLTTSTQGIADAFSPFLRIGVPVRVIPNTVHTFELAPEWTGNRRVLWRSNYSQLRDMWTCRTDQQRLEANGYPIAYIGAPPPWVDNPGWMEWGPAISYFSKLKEAGAGYFWKPLEDNEFNRCKSNIAMLEGAMAGALTISNFKGGDWLPAISAEEVVNRDDAWKRKRYAKMLEFIGEQFNSAKANQTRYDLIREMMGG